MTDESKPRGRRLTTLDATLLVMGGILGIGIFLTPQLVAVKVPEGWAFIAVWVVGGLFALAAALTFAEWGASFPEAGGWYVFLRESLGRQTAFLFAWIVLFVVSTGAIAAVAGFAAGALDDALPTIDLSGYRSLIAGLLISAVTLVCLSGVKSSALFQNAIMVVKLSAVGGLLLAGFLLAAPESVEVAGEQLATSADGGLDGSGMASALLPVFFAYGGWQMVCYIAPQVEDPARTLPRAIILGVSGVILIYVALAVCYLQALGIHGLAADEQFAKTLSVAAFGDRGGAILSAGLAVSALGFLVVTILGTPWLYVAMAREGLFFPSFARLSQRDAPARGLLLQWCVSIVYLTASLAYLVDAVVFAEWVFHGLVAYGLIRYRRRNPGAVRPYVSPLFPLAPLAYLVAAIAVVASQFESGQFGTIALGGGVIASGAVAFRFMAGRGEG